MASHAEQWCSHFFEMLTPLRASNTNANQLRARVMPSIALSLAHPSSQAGKHKAKPAQLPRYSTHEVIS